MAKQWFSNEETKGSILVTQEQATRTNSITHNIAPIKKNRSGHLSTKLWNRSDQNDLGGEGEK